MCELQARLAEKFPRADWAGSFNWLTGCAGPLAGLAYFGEGRSNVGQESVGMGVAAGWMV